MLGWESKCDPPRLISALRVAASVQRSDHGGESPEVIAWQLQVEIAGDLPERAWARAAEIADEGVLNGRVDGARHAVSKRKRKRFDRRLPVPGTELSRVYRDRRILVQVVAGGFEYEGQRYRSLSAVARQVTGTRWNGLVFFGLAKRGETALTGHRPK